jgi:hypothetical protein
MAGVYRGHPEIAHPFDQRIVDVERIHRTQLGLNRRRALQLVLILLLIVDAG